MINKQNLWFLTLFSLILVLSVYYITMPNELLLTNNSAKTEEVTSDKSSSDTTKNNEESVVKVEESEVLTSLRVNLDEERAKKKKELESLLTNTSITTEEKNNAYNELQELNKLSTQETSLEKKLKDKYKMDIFVKIDNKEVTVVANNSKHDVTLANNIMRSVQEDFKDKVYVTVQFK